MSKRITIRRHWIQRIEQALKLGKADILRDAAHKLCGMIAAYSTRAAEAASEQEDVAAQGDLAKAIPQVARPKALAQDLIVERVNLRLDELGRLAELSILSSSSGRRSST
jgi:hypothetical protein